MATDSGLIGWKLAIGSLMMVLAARRNIPAGIIAGQIRGVTVFDDIDGARLYAMREIESQSADDQGRQHHAHHLPDDSMSFLLRLADTAKLRNAPARKPAPVTDSPYDRFY